MLPSVTQTTSASRIIRISGLITFTFRLWPDIPSPQLHISPLPGRVWGSVLRWWLAFPQAGFSPAGEYEFISARQCTLWQNPGIPILPNLTVILIVRLLFTVLFLRSPENAFTDLTSCEYISQIFRGYTTNGAG